MSGWTPGPWRLRPRTNVLLGADGSVVGSASICWESRPRDLANARLMAAAPELYEALEGLITCRGIAVLYVTEHGGIGEETNAYFDRAEAALAKAQGDHQ